MNEFETLHQILARSIEQAQLSHDDVKKAAIAAAEAFAAGLAAYGKATSLLQAP